MATQNKTFTQPYDISFRNNNDKDIEAKFRFAKPDAFKNNLNSKQIRCQKFTLSNTYIPLFIPDRVTNESYFNVVPGATADLSVDNTLTIDSLEYFFIVRQNNNAKATVQYVVHIPENPTLTPPYVPITDDSVYYTTDYYYYHSLEHFFKILEDEINSAVSTLDGGYDGNCNITINPSTNSFSMYIDKDFINNNTIEFSESFLRLFPFKNSLSPYTTGQKSYVLDFPEFEASSGALTYKLISCPMYEAVFPFSELLISSDDLGVNFTQFISDEALIKSHQSGTYQSTILAFNMRTTVFTGIYDFYIYVNNDDSLWNNFYLNENTDKFITINIGLRLKNNIVIPMKLKKKDLFTMTLELKVNI